MRTRSQVSTSSDKDRCMRCRSAIRSASATIRVCASARAASQSSGPTLSQMQHLRDLFEAEPVVVGSLDEPHHGHSVGRVGPIPRVRPWWLRQQAPAFVVPQSLDVHAGADCQFATAHAVILNPVPGYRVK